MVEPQLRFRLRSGLLAAKQKWPHGAFIIRHILRSEDLTRSRTVDLIVTGALRRQADPVRRELPIF